MLPDGSVEEPERWWGRESSFGPAELSEMGVSSKGNGWLVWDPREGPWVVRDNWVLSSATLESGCVPPVVVNSSGIHSIFDRWVSVGLPFSCDALAVPNSEINTSSTGGRVGGCLPNVKGNDEAVTCSSFFTAEDRGGYVASIGSCGMVAGLNTDGGWVLAVEGVRPFCS